MEPIKIVDKLTLRQEALRMAVELNKAKNKDSLFIRTDVELFARLIQGDADLPEYVDPHSEHRYFADLIAKMQENFKSNPLSMWISADSEMKPAHEAEVLVMCKDDSTPLLAEYLGDNNWDVFDADVTKNTLQGEIEVVAWMPIPPFVEPLKL